MTYSLIVHDTRDGAIYIYEGPDLAWMNQTIKYWHARSNAIWCDHAAVELPWEHLHVRCLALVKK